MVVSHDAWYDIPTSRNRPKFRPYFLDVGISCHASFDTGGFGKPFDTRCAYWRILPSGDDEIFDTTSISTTCRTWPKEETIRIRSSRNKTCQRLWWFVRWSGAWWRMTTATAGFFPRFAHHLHQFKQLSSSTIKIWDEVLGWERIFDGSASAALMKPFRTLKWLPPVSTHNNIEEQANLLFVLLMCRNRGMHTGLGSIAKHCK